MTAKKNKEINVKNYYTGNKFEKPSKHVLEIK